MTYAVANLLWFGSQTILGYVSGVGGACAWKARGKGLVNDLT